MRTSLIKDLSSSRRLAAQLAISALLMANLSGALAAVHYVDATSSNAAAPYASWATAAKDIQDAVDAAEAGDVIVVTNGTYAGGGRAVYGILTNRVAVDKPLRLLSVNGPEVTIIQGSHDPGAATGKGDGAVRCVYLTNGASLTGFTLTNGATRASRDDPANRESSGGGLWCESTNDVAVSNCVVAGNLAYYLGGGAYGGTLNNCTLTGNGAEGSYLRSNFGAGGGASGCALNHCTVTGNVALANGGGVYGSALNNCKLAGNFASYGDGGGASACTLNDCDLTNNSADFDGGGAAYCTLNNCTLIHNSALGNDPAFNWDGGAGGGALECTLDHCTLSTNFASGRFAEGGAAAYSTLANCMLTSNEADNASPDARGGGASACTLNNCTLTENYAGFQGGGASGSRLTNCILDSNWVMVGSYRNYDYTSTLNHCCATPQPTDGVGNITNAPLFVDSVNGNQRLQSNSPCINAGDNLPAGGGTDLDGNPRVAGGNVDIGAYEFQSPTSAISYAWLLQYGLPTDGSADFADPDGDGLNNWQEWRCGTDPTNALSALRLLAPALVGSDLVVNWESVAGVSYFLERSPSLATSTAFRPLATSIPGQPGTTTYTDTNAMAAGPWFYRVGVSPP